MKKTYFSLIVFALASTFCIGQEVTAEQKMLITKITATWCPNCGTGAWDVKKDLVKDYGEDAIFLATHVSSSSDLYSSTARDYANNLPNVQGQPLFYLNRTRYNTGSITDAVKDMRSQTSGQTPLANAGVEMQLDGQTLGVKAKVQFFQPANGEYYLSLFIVEDKVVADQSSRGSNVEHSKIFRGRVTAETFGELITNGAVSANQTFDFRLNRAIPADWDANNLEVAAVIWEKIGETYEFVNVAAVSSFSTFTSVNVLEKEGVTLAVNPTTLTAQSTISLSIPTTQENLSLQLLNANGQLVKKIFSGTLSNGTHSFSLSKESQFASGVYLVQLEKEGSSITKRIVVQ